MSDNPTVRASIEPYLTVKGAKAAIAWYEDVFDATCLATMDAEDGERLMHATLSIGGSMFMMSDEFEEFSPHLAPDMERGSPVAISLRLETAADVDRIYDLALEKGAKNSWPPEDMFWGDRFAQIYDPFGHRWMLVSANPTA